MIDKSLHQSDIWTYLYNSYKLVVQVVFITPKNTEIHFYYLQYLFERTSYRKSDYLIFRVLSCDSPSACPAHTAMHWNRSGQVRMECQRLYKPSDPCERSRLHGSDGHSPGSAVCSGWGHKRRVEKDNTRLINWEEERGNCFITVDYVFHFHDRDDDVFITSV